MQPSLHVHNYIILCILKSFGEPTVIHGLSELGILLFFLFLVCRCSVKMLHVNLGLWAGHAS